MHKPQLRKAPAPHPTQSSFAIRKDKVQFHGGIRLKQKAKTKIHPERDSEIRSSSCCSSEVIFKKKLQAFIEGSTSQIIKYLLIT